MPALRVRFVGRERELHSLLHSLTQSGERGGAVALIGGESDIGKARLVWELAALEVAQGWLVLLEFIGEHNSRQEVSGIGDLLSDFVVG